MAYKQQFKNPWRPIWTGKTSEAGYQYERWEKVKKEDQDLVRLLQQASATVGEIPADATSVIRDGYKYWFNATSKYGDHGPQVARRREGSQGQTAPSYQQQTETIQGVGEDDKFEALSKRMDNAEKALAELYGLIGKDPFEKASAMSNTPNNHGQEQSGTHWAGSGIDVKQGLLSEDRIENIVPEEAEIEEATSGITSEEEKLLEP